MLLMPKPNPCHIDSTIILISWFHVGFFIDLQDQLDSVQSLVGDGSDCILAFCSPLPIYKLLPKLRCQKWSLLNLPICSADDVLCNLIAFCLTCFKGQFKSIP